MRNSAENYIARDKSLELDQTKEIKTTRQLEKSLPVDRSEEIDDAQNIEEVRKSIGDYSFKHRGSKYSDLESFHVDHDKGEMLAVGATDGELNHEDVKDRHEDEFELAEVDNSEAKRGKMVRKEEYNRETPKMPGSGHDNLKTWNDDKKERDKRGIIRKFFDRLN